MNMRMYIYLDKNIIKQLAPKMSDISFDIDFFEYSEKRGYTTNNNKSIRPDFEKENIIDCKDEHVCGRKRVGYCEDLGMLCNVEVVKRYINIEDVSEIKNNKFYYNIVESMQEDERIKRISGQIKELKENEFFISDVRFTISDEVYNCLKDLYKNNCEIECLGYRINCLKLNEKVFKPIAIYIN